VHVADLGLVDYRNYRTLSWAPAPRLNLLVGANAQGKTNLLEALGFLIAGRSFRTPRLGEVPSWGAPGACVSGELVRDHGRLEVRRVLARAASGAWQAQGEGCPWARAIAFGWQDLEIVHGAPGARRNFIDGFAARLWPAHLSGLARYRQVLARRNRLLQEGRGTRGLAERLQPWTEQLADLGAELVERRRRAVAALQTEISRVAATLAGWPASPPKLEVRYRTLLGEATGATALRAALERLAAEEVRRGATLVGPHRDDLGIELDGVEVRTFGSRGQQRLVALALRLAEVLPVTEAAGTAPIVLLDDALSELDPDVGQRVLREARTLGQVFLTSPEPLAAEGAAVFHVTAGGVAAA
jgi:DNA replication and repair protein RecF